MSVKKNSHQLTLFAEDSPVNLSQMLDGETAAKIVEIYGRNILELSERLSRVGLSVKTLEAYLPQKEVDSFVESSVTWPQSGMMRNGMLYPLVPLVSHTCEKGCSLLPTPQAMDAKGTCLKLVHKKYKTYHLKHWVHGTSLAVHSQTFRSSWPNPAIIGFLMGFPQHWLLDQPYGVMEMP